jgi:DNA-binding Xre family transcriptional regulator
MNIIEDFKTRMRIEKRISELMIETDLTAPTVTKFIKGDLDQLSVKNLKKLCKACNIQLSLFKFLDECVVDGNEIILE